MAAWRSDNECLGISYSHVIWMRLICVTGADTTLVAISYRSFDPSIQHTYGRSKSACISLILHQINLDGIKNEIKLIFFRKITTPERLLFSYKFHFCSFNVFAVPDCVKPLIRYISFHRLSIFKHYFWPLSEKKKRRHSFR